MQTAMEFDAILLNKVFHNLNVLCIYFTVELSNYFDLPIQKTAS